MLPIVGAFLGTNRIPLSSKLLVVSYDLLISKLITGLIYSTGSLNKSRSEILEVVSSFYSHLLRRKDLDWEVILSS